MSESTKQLEEALKYSNPYWEKERFSAPILERVCFLYSLGHKNHEIFLMVREEFEDMIASPITMSTIETLITKNKIYFDARRVQMGEVHKAMIEGHAIKLFKLTHSKEEKLVEIYAGKLDEALDELASLSLSEEDDNGNKTNTARSFVLIELIEKLQSKIAKLAGNDMFREVALLRHKLKLKQEFEPQDQTGLGLPPAKSNSNNAPIIID